MKSDVERGKLLKDNLPPRRSLGSERLYGLLFSLSVTCGDSSLVRGSLK